MKRAVAPIALIALFIVMLSGCFARPVELPSHEVSYTPRHLKGEWGKLRILQLESIDLNAYPHLRLKEGFALHRAIYDYHGADVRGFLVAVHEASERGFAVEPLSGVHGKFLFAPIESTAEALDYVKLMVHETPETLYLREHTYIHSPHDSETVLSALTEAASAFGRPLEMLETPPTNVTRVTEQSSGKYLVELVYRKYTYDQRIEYLACLVYSDGSLEFQESYVFIVGPPGALF